MYYDVIAFQLGGFGLPFFVVGSITVLNGAAGYFMIGHIDGKY
jgi:hypothetical protein